MVVDDHALFRTGLIGLLRADSEFEVAGEASDGQEFLDTFANLSPDVVLLDIDMPVVNGIEAAQKALEADPSLKIITL